MAYNNEVTYDKKWDTKENRDALKELTDRYFDRSVCSPDCPLAWAPDALSLLNEIDSLFGIMRNTSTIRGYHIDRQFFNHFIVGPFVSAKNTFYHNFIAKINNADEYDINRRNRPISTRLKEVVKSFFNPIKYGLRAFKIQYINALLNAIYKPSVSLNQVKEKYGYLTIYFSGPDYADAYIEKLIAKTEVKLAMKGCYYPVESLYNSGTSIPTNEDIIESHGYKYISTHRNVMVELGLNLEDVAQKYSAYKLQHSE